MSFSRLRRNNQRQRNDDNYSNYSGNSNNRSQNYQNQNYGNEKYGNQNLNQNYQNQNYQNRNFQNYNNQKYEDQNIQNQYYNNRQYHYNNDLYKIEHSGNVSHASSETNSSATDQYICNNCINEALIDAKNKPKDYSSNGETPMDIQERLNAMQRMRINDQVQQRIKRAE